MQVRFFICRRDFFYLQARLRLEYQRYRDYLAQLKAEEARQEKELEQMLEAEQKKVNSKNNLDGFNGNLTKLKGIPSILLVQL